MSSDVRGYDIFGPEKHSAQRAEFIRGRSDPFFAHHTHLAGNVLCFYAYTLSTGLGIVVSMPK